MARRKRNWHPKGFYHIVMRGNNRRNIFIDVVDMEEYHRVLMNAYYMHSFDIPAYCIMTNHVHLLLRSPEVHLGILMRHINKRYSDYYRKRHRVVGQIYQNRYYSKEVTDPRGLLEVSAYIHLNPMETKVPMVQKLEDYPHSSYPFYFHNQQSDYPFLKLDILPRYMPEAYQTTTAYARWCLEQKHDN